jgi:hypothetical protein
VIRIFLSCPPLNFDLVLQFDQKIAYANCTLVPFPLTAITAKEVGNSKKLTRSAKPDKLLSKERRKTKIFGKHCSAGFEEEHSKERGDVRMRTRKRMNQ